MQIVGRNKAQKKFEKTTHFMAKMVMRYVLSSSHDLLFPLENCFVLLYLRATNRMIII